MDTRGKREAEATDDRGNRLGGTMSLVMVSKEETTVHGDAESEGAADLALDYFGGLSGRETGSEAFVLDQQQGVSGARFYPVDQFQLVLGISRAKYDRLVVSPLILHYVDAFTSYVPPAEENPPLWLYTCRAEPAPLVSLLPTDNDQPSFRGRRNISVDVFEVRSIRAYGNRGVHVSSLIPEEEDGLRAERIVADSGAEIDLPSTHGTSGQFVFVSKGSILHGQREYAFESLGWMKADEASQNICAGKVGAECLIMRFPYPPSRTIRLAS